MTTKMTSSWMLALVTVALVALAPTVAVGQEGVCLNQMTLRARACPAGTSCTTKNATLTSSEGDDAFANVAKLCDQSEVFSGKTGMTLTGTTPSLALVASGAPDDWKLEIDPTNNVFKAVATSGSQPFGWSLKSNGLGSDFSLGDAQLSATRTALWRPLTITTGAAAEMRLHSETDLGARILLWGDTGDNNSASGDTGFTLAFVTSPREFRIGSGTSTTSIFRIVEDAPNDSIYLNASGQLGIGHASPSTKLHLLQSGTSTTPSVEVEQTSTGDAGLQFSIAGDAYAVGIDNSDGDKFKIAYAASEGGAVLGTNDRLTIDSTGVMIVGHSGVAGARLAQAFETVSANGFGGASFSTFAASLGGQSTLIDLNRSRSSTKGTQTIVQSGDTLGTVAFRGSDGTAFANAAAITSFVDGTPGASNDMPGRLEFQTVPDGSGTLTTRLTIDSTGLVTAAGTVAAAGLTLSGEGVIDDLGLEFTPGDALTDCSTFAATGGGIFYDDSENKFKKCQDNVLTDLDTGAGLGADAVGTSELNDGANTPTAGDFVIVDVGAASFDYRTPNAGTDVTADLEEEGQINASAVTGNAADDQVLLGSGASTLAYATVPNCNTDNHLTYTQATNTFGCEADDSGGGSGDITSVGDVASGAAFDGTQGTTLTFDNAGGDATLNYDGADLESSVKIKAPSFEAGAAAVPVIQFRDSDATAGDVNAKIEMNCQDPTPGAEDCRILIRHQRNGVEGDALFLTESTFWYGDIDVAAHVFTTDGTGNAEFVVPNDSIGDAEVVNALTIAGGTIGTSAITLVQSADPTPTAEGVIEWETDTDEIHVGDGATTKVFVAGPHTVEVNNLEATAPSTILDTEVFIGTGSGTGAFAALSGDVTMTNGGVVTIGSNAVALATDTTGDYVATIVAGAGLASTGATTGENIAHTLSTASTEAGFLFDLDAGALTCGASNQGKIAVLDNGEITWCDGATTSVVRKGVNLSTNQTITGTKTFSGSSLAVGATGWTNANHAHAAADSGGQIPIANTTGTLAVGRGGTGTTTSTGTGNVVLSASPTFTGDPIVPTASADDNDTSAASTAFVQQEINGAGGTNLTCSGGVCNVDDVFVLTSGDTMTGELVADDLGIEFTPGSLTDCSTFSATGGGIFYSDSENKFKKCQENVLTDLDAAGGGGLNNVVEDTTPQLGGQLDVNGQAIGDGTRELVTFVEDVSAVNQIEIENEATGSGPIIRAAGDDTNIDLNLVAKGTGSVKFGTGGGSATIDAIGAVAMNYGSADVTAHVFTADGATDADFVVPNNSIGSAEIDTIVMSIPILAGGTTADGTQCADPAKVTVNGIPQYTIICADNDGSSIYFDVPLPDSYDGGTFAVKQTYIQTAADTSALNGDIAAFCRDAGESNNTYGGEAAMDDTNVTGSNGEDEIISGPVTGTNCTAGDARAYFRYQVDQGGTTTAMATLHFTSFLVEYTSTVGD